MSNIDKRALREAAEKATKGQWVVEFDDEIYSTDGVNNEQIAMVFSENEARDAAFIAAANPAAVLALLDELEALKLANAAQDDHINQQQDRIDLLEKGNNEAARQINSWRRLAKQNIAEREKDVSELNIARKRIAELEAREKSLRTVGVMSQKAFQRLEGRESRFIALWPRPEIYLPRKRPDDGVIVYARVAGAGKGEAS
ncbi:ead/Ea22-like family protein [Enterobacter hormaechei]|uniref:ead/Ea22-like family protein n=1 Tax=Enterobacter hormaechei TaxID=158836 RepID=UPI002FD86D44